jgi:phytanoyl-CoA hydroxylase
MKLKPEQLDTFRKKGWLVIEGVFLPAVVEEVAGRALKVAESEMEELDVARLVEVDERGQVAGPRKVEFPFLKDEIFRRLLLSGPLPELVAQLLGKPALVLRDQIFMKPPHHGSPKCWHQDNAYFLLEPADEVLTAWIACDDADEGNGCLRYIDGSHLLGILPATTDPEQEHELIPDPGSFDESANTPACVRKGGVVFHYSNTLHHSGPNQSDRWRRAYASHWCTADVKGDLIREAYFETEPALYAGA